MLGSSALACDSGDDMGDGEATGDTTDNGDGDGDGDGDAGLSHAADIQPIWDDNCVTGCHMPGGVYAALDLSVDATDNLIGSATTQAAGKTFVEAGNSANSYVIAKLRGTQMEFGGQGASMPAGSGAAPLPEDTIALIEQWIDEGALP
ncbi:hypothetical protein DB30_00682 [Enhygromyxa salina]|uniref:Cytochrome c domain-containing protein n=1 Tax=Enhygromyxa salina TaxID=215803 RepID=A0A0C2DFK2_9BACT|nr:hypothetical protein DB30_00682 [Enhygromyxa salina]